MRSSAPRTRVPLLPALLVGLLALLAPLLGAAPAPPAAAAVAADRAGLPPVAPVPQEARRTGPDLRLGAAARLVAGPGADRAAVRLVRSVLRGAGVRPVTGDAPVVVRVAGPRGGAGAAAALRSLRVQGPGGLPEEGYVLAAGRVRGTTQVVLAGVDGAGQLHAAHTLRQLVRLDARGATLPRVAVRDWPELQWRGTIEGFYGDPWSHEDRLRQLDEYAADKMDTYVYAPKDDPFHRERWREPYPAAERALLAELVARGRGQHVDVVFTVSPGLDVCYSSPADQRALLAKAQDVWDLGVRTYGILLDDIGSGLHCAEDEARFGADASPLAAAQAHLLNAFQRDFLDTHPGAGRLLTVPTEYSGNGTSPYRERFAVLLEERAVVMWTGAEVVPPTVTDEDADAASAVFRHDLLLWDNYPVNDYLPRQLFLGPLTGRSPSLGEHGVVGITANPMPQAAPSLLALQTVADYAWNPDAYDPERSWQRAVHDLGGDAAAALRVFAENSRSSDLDRTESPRLVALLAAYEASGSRADALRLQDHFEAMAAAPGRLRERMGDPDFVEQAAPWLTKLRWYGVAGAASVRSLLAEQDGDGTRAWRQRVLADRAAQAARQTYETVATGVVPPFLERAAAASRVVELSAPAAAAPGDDVRLAADVDAGAVRVSAVRFYAGTTEVGVDRTAPYELVLPDAPEGLHLVTARAESAVGAEVPSAPVRLTVGAPDPVLLLVGDDAPVPAGAALSSGDEAVRQRLELLGHPVQVVQGAEATTQDAQGKAAVVITSTLASSEAGTKFRDSPVPVLTYEAFVLDDMGMATAPGEAFRSSQLEVVDPASPLAAGLSGVVDVYRGADRVRFGTPAASAEVGAVVPGQPQQGALFGYAAGDAMVDLVAPAARVALPFGDEGVDPDVVTDEGLALFDAAVRWAVPSPLAAPAPGAP
ncbi:beta-N-acetylglucosaminidase domain-containing protein [Vallicoccus soli]|uniref:Beta-N-acetylhexosaminidase n=1 Tax=Vallicoccus soli TaxID=2339232 RepID=A0A3A3ZMR2_9ACTN|nr:beta-N-acetylglucosaminidase domain-containing protein [Vallicoccus soli]RJK98005.1 beta-N-acetylhexosaminidase [Vallicoccus soli]